MRNYCYSVFFLAFGVAQLAGCIRAGSGAGSLTFSADGEQVCYLREDRIEEDVVDGKTWLRSISLHWCNTSAPTSERSVHIESLGWEYRGYGTVVTDVAWSPKGSRIGVLTPHRVVVVAAETAETLEIRDGRISSFAWLAEGEVAYATRRTRGDRQQRVICRQDLQTHKKTDVVALPERLAGGSPCQKEQWAPSGRFAVLTEPEYGGQCHCVDVSNGTVRAFGQTNAYQVGVAWSPDSSRVFSVSGKIGANDVHEALLFEPLTGRIVDCTNAFRKAFPDRFPRLERLWAADGEYMLVNTLDTGGSLVRAEPWKVVRLGLLLAPRLSKTGPSRMIPHLFRLPVPGWVGVRRIGPYDDGHTFYAADYSGQHVLPLPSGDVSPDGTLAARLERGKVKIHPLGIWWVPSSVSPLPGGRGNGDREGLPTERGYEWDKWLNDLEREKGDITDFCDGGNG